MQLVPLLELAMQSPASALGIVGNPEQTATQLPLTVHEPAEVAERTLVNPVLQTVPSTEFGTQFPFSELEIVGIDVQVVLVQTPVGVQVPELH